MKELLDSMIEFLEDNLGENYIWIAAGAAVLLIAVIALIAAVRRRSRPEEGERDFFLEGEYDTIIRDEARAARAAGCEPDAVVETAEEPAGSEVSDEGADETDVTEITAEEQDALKEELQQVHININIERGQVRIGCEEDGRVTCIVEAEEETGDPELTAALASVKMDESPEISVPADGREVLDNQGIILEKINLVKAAPAKKFGPDNFNTGRSGRVFTEEELREQIKQ